MVCHSSTMQWRSTAPFFSCNRSPVCMWPKSYSELSTVFAVSHDLSRGCPLLQATASQVVDTAVCGEGGEGVATKAE